MMDDGTLSRTPLYDLHVAAGAKMVEFGGWLMPVQYSGIIEEHRKVRSTVGLFDLSHMGRISVSGPDCAQYLQALATNDLGKLEPGKVQYSLICNRSGGVRDDILVYCLGKSEYLLVVNASNRQKVLGWMGEIKEGLKEQKGSADVDIEDQTVETVMVGLQGPLSQQTLQPLTSLLLDPVRYYRSSLGTVMGVEGLISRTGYTGEDGFEIIVPADAGSALWEELARAVAARNGVLAGLGARDTLRLEAGMPLYGHELDETINPFEVRLDRYVHLEKSEMVGREALQEVASSGPKRCLIGLEVSDRAIARQGTPVMLDGVEVGRVTSGSYSPTLDLSIAMALVRSDVAAARPSLCVSVRGGSHEAHVVDMPFYRRAKSKLGES
ncbi:MAG TPA: glycine cleavage system aminomethyltransferase GcvT [Chloroflexota bacterium]|nr:glycine cleavage system aminomethyltransferase GcvT [Chloroflexota bacterium]